MSDCIFCRIVEGELPSERVYEDDRVVAFKDARPAAPIHVLIVPRRHISTLNDVEEGDDLIAHIGHVARQIAREHGVADSGYRFVINVNRGGGQVIFHLHAHLMAGKDLGTILIGMAVMCSTLWRRVLRLFQGG
jgi:histidine triad (HIT) family protein